MVSWMKAAAIVGVSGTLLLLGTAGAQVLTGPVDSTPPAPVLHHSNPNHHAATSSTHKVPVKHHKHKHHKHHKRHTKGLTSTKTAKATKSTSSHTLKSTTHSATKTQGTSGWKHHPFLKSGNA
jgi:hypothetical protein